MENDKLFKKYIPMTETFFYILSSLTEAKHGYGIIKHVAEVTNERITLGAGTIYGTLAKMQKDGLIYLYEDQERRSVYLITDLGRALLKEEVRRLREVTNYLSEVEKYL